MDNANTLIGVQEEFAAAFASAKRKWAHSKVGGHADRSIRGARKVAAKRLATLGFDEVQITAALADAKDMAELELACE